MIGHFAASSAMDAAASATGVTAVAPPWRYLMSNQLTVISENEITHEPLAYAGPQKEQQAHYHAGVDVSPVWSTHLCTAGAAPYSAVVGEFVLSPAGDGDQPSARVQHRPTRQMCGAPRPHPPLHIPILMRQAGSNHHEYHLLIGQTTGAPPTSVPDVTCCRVVRPWFQQ